MRLRIKKSELGNFKSSLKVALPFFMLMIIQGCDLFGGDDEDVQLPTELVEFEAVIEVDEKWDVSVGKGHEGMVLGLKPTTDGEQIYAASFDGNVIAFDTNSCRF